MPAFKLNGVVFAGFAADKCIPITLVKKLIKTRLLEISSMAALQEPGKSATRVN